MNRKQRRAATRVAKRSGNTDIQEKLEILNHLKEECFVCETPFDKTDMTMLDDWSVVVYGDKQAVRLYCTKCWNGAKEFVKSNSM
jgi:hypothetical protein